MIGARINFNTTAITQAFKKLQNPDNSELMRNVASIVEDSTEQAFESETSPNGEAWPDLSTAYQAWSEKRGYDGKMLQVSGQLATSIITEHGADFAQIGSKVVVDQSFRRVIIGLNSTLHLQQ